MIDPDLFFAGFDEDETVSGFAAAAAARGGGELDVDRAAAGGDDGIAAAGSETALVTFTGLADVNAVDLEAARRRRITFITILPSNLGNFADAVTASNQTMITKYMNMTDYA